MLSNFTFHPFLNILIAKKQYFIYFTIYHFVNVLPMSFKVK